MWFWLADGWALVMKWVAVVLGLPVAVMSDRYSAIWPEQRWLVSWLVVGQVNFYLSGSKMAQLLNAPTSSRTFSKKISAGK